MTPADSCGPAAHRRGLFVALRDRLSEPRLRGLDLDSDELLLVQRKILLEKKMLRGVFADFYKMCFTLDERFLQGGGDRVEIGAGVSLFKSYYPQIISTDIKSAPYLDRVVDAQETPFSDGSIRSIYGINCFHHLPDPEAFLAEVRRVLVPRGGCILIEPFYGPVARRFFARLFDSEHFDMQKAGWCGDEMTIMKGANQALAYVVFVRDRQRFEDKFPELEIVLHKPFGNYLRYLLSGGLNFRQLLPDLAIPIVRLLETCVLPLRSLLALHHVIVLRKRAL